MAGSNLNGITLAKIETNTPEGFVFKSLKEMVPKIQKAKENMYADPGQYGNRVDKMFSFITIAISYPEGKQLSPQEIQQIEGALSDVIK